MNQCKDCGKCEQGRRCPEPRGDVPIALAFLCVAPLLFVALAAFLGWWFT